MMNTASDAHHACKRTHGTAGDDLLALIPSPAPSKAKGDPFLTLTPRAAKAWMALFSHARTHGAWQPRPTDPSRPELAEPQQYILGARWTVAGLAHALGVNRDTAAKGMRELVQGGWVRRQDQRNMGQFGGLDYSLAVPASVTQADKVKVAEGLKQRGLAFGIYRWRTAARVLEDHEIQRVQQEVLLEISTEQADVAGDPQKAIDLVSDKIKRLAKGD